MGMVCVSSVDKYEIINVQIKINQPEHTHTLQRRPTALQKDCTNDGTVDGWRLIEHIAAADDISQLGRI